MSFLKATIEEINGEQVTLKFENEKRLELPIFVFEGTPEVDKEVRLRAAVLGAEDTGQTDLAKELINEILGSS